MRRSALRDFLTRVLPLSAPLFWGGCCPDDIVDVVVIVDGGVPGGLTDAACAQICANGEYPPGKRITDVRGCLEGDLDMGEYLCVTKRLLCGGRAVSGFRYGLSSGPLIGQWFSRMAALESASVVAFRRLARELASFEAPTALIHRTSLSALEERRHARVILALAEHFGSGPASVSFENADTHRSLEAVARENSVEGVRELWGAVVNAWQSRHSADPLVRDTLADIANDESGHADLAADIEMWALGRLPEASQRRVRDAKRAAVAAVLDDAGLTVPSELVEIAGLPPSAVARQLATELAGGVWSS